MTKRKPGKCSTSWPKKRKYKAHSVYWVADRGVCLNCGKGFLKRVRARSG